jgi:spiro-SPASM protein
MKSAVVLNALVDGDWHLPRAGIDPTGLLLQKARTLSEGSVFMITDNASAEKLKDKSGYTDIRVSSRSQKEVFRKVGEVLSGAGVHSFVYLFIDTPLLDTDVSERMLRLHTSEMADYTSGEGFPQGIAPEIVKTGALPRIASLVKDPAAAVSRGSLFEALSGEINSFDLETLFSPRDLKMSRIQLSTSRKREALLVERVLERTGPGCTCEDFCDLLDRAPGIVRTVPAYLELEITSQVAGECIYSPRQLVKRRPGSMDFERFRDILDLAAEYCGGIHLSLSHLCEPLAHPEIERFIENAAGRQDVHLVLETGGRLLDPAFTRFLTGFPDEKISVVFQVDAVSPKVYTSIRKGDLARVERNLRFLLSAGKKNVYAQLTRLDLNEEEILPFFDRWEKEGAKVIIQKYNPYLNMLPEGSGPDMSPLKRHTCWHLQRDLVVFHDGSVPRCRQDINTVFNLGRLPEDGFEQVWRHGEPFYIDHCAGRYDQYCTVCDEYYTYNF